MTVPFWILCPERGSFLLNRKRRSLYVEKIHELIERLSVAVINLDAMLAHEIICELRNVLS